MSSNFGPVLRHKWHRDLDGIRKSLSIKGLKPLPSLEIVKYKTYLIKPIYSPINYIRHVVLLPSCYTTVISSIRVKPGECLLCRMVLGTG